MSLGGVQGFHERYASCEVGTKVWMICAVLCLRALADAVGQDCFQQIEVRTRNVRFAVYNRSCEVLPDALPHDPRLAMICGKSFFEQDRSQVDREAIHAFLKILASGKCQVVGIAR